VRRPRPHLLLRRDHDRCGAGRRQRRRRGRDHSDPPGHVGRPIRTFWRSIVAWRPFPSLILSE
jgi:hypothetical protein